MRNLILIRKLVLILFFPIAILLIKIASHSPVLVEKIYSRGFYRIISQLLSLTAAWVPFSLIELLVVVFVLVAIAITTRSIVRLVKSPSGRGRTALNYLLNILAFVSVLYFIFVATFDLNYQRLPFSQITGMDVRPATADELYNVCKGLTQHANSLRPKVKEDSAGSMKLSRSLSETFRDSSKGYSVAAGIYPELGGTYSNPKGLLFSRVLTLLWLQGIHCPLTQEANVNIEIPDCMIPSTACHEMAHQRGFAREDEANYISYLTCSKNPDVDFQYSGELLALIYSMNALYSTDREKYEQVYKEYSPGIIRDLSSYNKFWDRFRGPVANAGNSLNDAYLKANNQRDGVKSYGRMVDLLIAQYRKYGPDS
jgi:hypothetical protein